MLRKDPRRSQLSPLADPKVQRGQQERQVDWLTVAWQSIGGFQHRNSAKSCATGKAAVYSARIPCEHWFRSLSF